MTHNAYQVLEIAPSSDLSAIKAAYYQLSKIYHPDGTNPDLEQWRLIETSYRILINPALRKQHDFYWNIKSEQIKQNPKQLIWANQNDEQVSADLCPDLVINYRVDLLTYWVGKRLMVDYYRRQICQARQCQNQWKQHQCQKCQALGYVQGDDQRWIDCLECQASGLVINLDHRCQNQLVKQQVELILWPGGLKNLTLHFANQGHQKRDGQYQALMVAIVVVNNDPNWKLTKQGLEQNLTLPVSFVFRLKSIDLVSPWNEVLKLNLTLFKDSKQKMMIQGKRQLMKQWSDFDLYQVLYQPFCYWIKIKWIFNDLNQFESDYHRYLKQMLLKLKANGKS